MASNGDILEEYLDGVGEMQKECPGAPGSVFVRPLTKEELERAYEYAKMTGQVT